MAPSQHISIRLVTPRLTPRFRPELIDVDKKASALETLHDVITSKRHRNNWTLTSEQIILLFLELCVDMRRAKTARDGLYQYKNLCQQISLGSLETVIRKFAAHAEAKADEARSVASAAVLEIDDLDASETPESLILSIVTGADTQDRTDREVVAPWLKFLWEVYRLVLELLRNNSKVEALYQVRQRRSQTNLHCVSYCLLWPVGNVSRSVQILREIQPKNRVSPSVRPTANAPCERRQVLNACSTVLSVV